MDSATTVRGLLSHYGLSAKKSWGQNFLINDRVYAAIVAACHAGPGQTVLEIGAGLGTLTTRLLDTGATVIAVERERDMCTVLRSELADRAGFLLREENALTLDVAGLADMHQGPFIVVGNLPYQIASPLIFHFLSFLPLISRVVVMLQRELADRLSAPCGSRDYSAMAAQIQLIADVRRICQAGPGSFYPAPRVASTVVVIEPRPSPMVPVQDLRRYSQVVRAAFGQRRKTLRNALLFAYGEAGEAAIRLAGLDPSRRGETLSIAEFARLSDCLTSLPPGERGDA